MTRVVCPVLPVAVIISFFGIWWFSKNDEKPVVKLSGPAKRAPGLEFRRLQLLDENGMIDPDGLRKAKEHVEKMKAVALKAPAKPEDRILEAAITPDSWSWMGPGNIGGRIRSILIDRNNANNVWAGSVSGGIWQSSNAGATWFPVDDFMANLSVTTLAANPANANVMYAGTGEGFANLDAIQGNGIFRTTDLGLTWSQLPSTNNPNFNFVNRITISPNGTIILAATQTGLWRSTDSGVSWTATSTTNREDVAFQPASNTQALSTGPGVAQFSTDGGQTWNASVFTPPVVPTATNNGRIEIAYAPNLATTVYAGVNQNNGEVYRSTDGGQNFTRVNTGTSYMLGAANQGWYDNAIWVNPQNSNFVIVGGIHLWRSTDGGTTFTQISNGGSTAHADHHFIVSPPGFNNNTNRVVFFGNDGGIYRTNDISTVSLTTGWTNLNNNLGVTQFYSGAASRNGIIIGGTQDNGTVRYTGGIQSWGTLAGGDGGFVASDQTDPNRFYGETQNLGVFRSTDTGQTSQSITSGLTDANQTPARANFIAPLVLDPIDPNRLLAGGWSLWRTIDARAVTPTWAAIKPPVVGNIAISAIAISPGNSDFIVVAHNNGTIFRTFNGTQLTPTWTQIGTPTFPAGRFVTRIVIDNSRTPNWIYATLGGFSTNNVQRSTDLGLTWTDITGISTTSLPNVPVRALAIHPVNRNLLYVGTEVGVFTSDNAGATWDASNGGPANVSVDELFWRGGDLIAATHGRGMYRASGGSYVDCNYTGVQVGTFDQPYRTLTAAINAVSRYQPIWLKPCNYNEQITTNKRLEIRSLGISNIGLP